MICDSALKLLYSAHSPMPMPEYLLLTGNCETIKAGKLEPKSATDISMQPCPSTAPQTVRVEIFDPTKRVIDSKTVNQVWRITFKASA